MVSKSIKVKVGQTIDYKVIKDTYKTITDRIVVSEDMDSVETIGVNAPSEPYIPNLDYTISNLGEHKVITFNNDIVLPDDVVMEKDEYALIPYDGDVHYISQDNVEDRWNDNFNRVGSVQIVGNTASNFSSSNYISLQDTFDSSKPWIVGFKFNLNVVDNTSKILLCHNTSGLFKLTIYEGKIEFSVSTTTSDWTIGQIVGTQVLQPHKDYWVKAEFTGSAYNVYISEDGLNYNLEGTLESSEAFVMPSQLLIGNGGWQMDEAFTGVIDLNETYIESDGEIWWKPQVANMLENFIKYGSPTFTNGIVNNFSSSNYIALNSEFVSNNNATYVLKFTTGDDITTDQVIIQKRYFIDIEISASEGVLFYTWNPSRRTSWFTPEANTTYWLKVVIDGLNRTYSYSTNGIDYSEGITIEDASLSTTDSANLCLGLHSVQFVGPFLGSIDLKESYIKINDELVWEGFKKNKFKKSNFKMIGSPNIDMNGVISNFSDYNYIESLYAGNNETEIFTTFTTGTDISTMANIMTFQGCGEIYIRDSVLQTWNIETSTDMTLTSMLPNTMYSLRMKMIPNGRIITIYDADNTIIDEHTINDLGATFNNNSIIRFGFYDANSTFRYWRGSIDLANTYVIIDDVKYNLLENAGKYLQGILDKETDATTLKLFANTLVMEKDDIVYPFKQPTMTSNGVMGNSIVACSSSKNVYNNMYPYYVFNNDNTTWHTDSSSSPWDIIYYSKEAIKPTKINIINRNNDPSYIYPATSLTVYGSTNGTTYTQIGYTENSVTTSAGQWSCDIETPMVVNYLKFVFTNNYNYFALTYIGIEAEIVKQFTHKGILLLAEDKNLQNNGLFVQYIGDVEIPTFEEDNEGSDEPESFFHNYYAWTTTTTGTSLPTTVYTLSTTPSVGDTIYDEHGEATTMTAIGVASDYSYINPGNQPAFFLPPEYYRDSEKDIMKNDSPGLDIGDGDIGDGDIEADDAL